MRAGRLVFVRRRTGRNQSGLPHRVAADANGYRRIRLPHDVAACHVDDRHRYRRPDTLTLTGNAISPVITLVVTDRIRLLRWTTTRGASGQLQATFGFVRETTWGPNSMRPIDQIGKTWRLTYDAECVNA